jgi:hypothetical protein
MNEHLHVGFARDLSNPRDRRLYRALEILPGFLAWATLALVIILSRIAPIGIAFFIIAFDVYWLIKTIYLSFHMRSTFNIMRANLKRDWMAELASSGKPWNEMYHLVILPFYKEPASIIRGALASLAHGHYPADRFIIVLSTEERGGEESQVTLRAMEQEFGSTFFKFLTTTHPAGIPGEIPGKGSNESWAGRHVLKEVIAPLNISHERILVSVFDIDTVVPKDFFACLTWNFFHAEHPLRSSYQPIPIFTNNIWEAPAFARVFAFSTTFWQMIQQARPERLVTFSSQSISFKALVDIDFWQTNVVSEDSRIFWQCLLKYDGDWRTVPLHFPVYMDANVAPTFWQTLKNQYKQIRRWAFGVENNPYLLFGFIKNKRMPLRQKLSMGLFMVESSHSFATNSFIIFLLGWLPLAFGGHDFSQNILSYNLPQITRFIMNLAMVGLVTSAIVTIMLLPERPKTKGKWQVVWMGLQWVLFPINIIFFGAIPALDAQTRLMFGKYLGFWVTPKARE